MSRSARPPRLPPRSKRGWERRARGTLAILLCLAGVPALAQEGKPARAAAGKPARIASLNLCGDELLLRLADRDRIASVTFLAAEPASSNVANLAHGLPTNRGLAEEIVPLEPDLVITGAFTTRATSDLLRTLGVPVLELPMPATLEEAYGQIRQVAERIGEPARGEAMIARMQADMAALPSPHAPDRSAIVLRPNGFTAGKGSLADDLMARAGLDNLAARLPADKLGQLPLEEVVVAHPDLLVVDTDPAAPPSLAESILDHPALRPFSRQGRTVALPARLWACAGPELASAAARLSAAPKATRSASQAMAPLVPLRAAP
ncbi:ABC transporter substrate-binding protein [Aquabacter sp. P-9]|uniref:ABC transporter substrate-binding protein n=1 Tax=Aquabacter sediminis TaxID=3029197 RepID=UPI00237D9D85|nr:ABC transporter substrate-binding protein [Aquabacter sp. P-9]MDE1567781.1 ABC transporter substrate-binding protein [Aquabacter sp. P-9]